MVVRDTDNTDKLLKADKKIRQKRADSAQIDAPPQITGKSV